MKIVTEGFSQLIQKKTRSWRGQQDSCVDHVWSNVPQLAISLTNEERCPSDHHVMGVNIRLKGQEGNSLEYLSRKRSMFDKDRFRENLKDSQWEDFYLISNPELANKWLEDRIKSLLQEECPLRKVQPSNRIKSWITGESLEICKLRDQARHTAKTSDLDRDWTEFKRLKNLATKSCRSDKKRHFSQLFEFFEDKNDSQGLFKTIKKTVGLERKWTPTSPCH